MHQPSCHLGLPTVQWLCKNSWITFSNPSMIGMAQDSRITWMIVASSPRKKRQNSIGKSQRTSLTSSNKTPCFSNLPFWSNRNQLPWPMAHSWRNHHLLRQTLSHCRLAPQPKKPKRTPQNSRGSRIPKTFYSQLCSNRTANDGPA